MIPGEKGLLMCDARRFVEAVLFLCLAVPLAVAQTTSTAQVTFTTIDVPGAVVTSVQGINTAGDLVGYYATASNGSTHAFLYRGGTFSFLDYPEADSTRALGINDSGLIVGAAIKGESNEIGFLYDGVTFTPIRVTGKSATVAWGINNGGDIVGGDGSLSETSGYELRGHRLKLISPPGTYLIVYATGINDTGEIVGFASELNTSGFAYRNGKYQTIAFPGATQTEALGINGSGTVVGFYSLPPSFFGFALKGRHYISINFPGAKYTLALGINASGQAVGSYTTDQVTYHGFLTTPIAGTQ